MCICCCTSRKALLIYAIVVTTITVGYGIFSVANFGSNTEVYKYLKAKIEVYDGLISLYSYIHLLDDEDIAYSIQDAISIGRIYSLTSLDFETTNYKLIPILKGIENGAGVAIFVLSILFLLAEIVYLIFACGIRETQLASNSVYCVLNILKTITYTLAIIAIFYSAAYGAILIVILVQYMALVRNIDSCSLGIIYGIVYAYYSFWAYITLSCIFGRERQLFKSVGSVANPGTAALFDINGNPIARAGVSTQVVVVPQGVVQPMNYPCQNLGNTNQQADSTYIQNQRPIQIRSSERNVDNDKSIVKMKKKKKKKNKD